MNDDLMRRLSEALDSPQGIDGDTELGHLVASDPEAAAYVEDVALIQRTLLDLDSELSPGGDSEIDWDAQTSKILASLDAPLPDLGDVTAPPRFEDDTGAEQDAVRGETVLSADEPSVGQVVSLDRHRRRRRWVYVSAVAAAAAALLVITSDELLLSAETAPETAMTPVDSAEEWADEAPSEVWPSGTTGALQIAETEAVSADDDNALAQAAAVLPGTTRAATALERSDDGMPGESLAGLEAGELETRAVLSVGSGRSYAENAGADERRGSTRPRRRRARSANRRGRSQALNSSPLRPPPVSAPPVRPRSASGVEDALGGDVINGFGGGGPAPAAQARMAPRRSPAELAAPAPERTEPPASAPSARAAGSSPRVNSQEENMDEARSAAPGFDLPVSIRRRATTCLPAGSALPVTLRVRDGRVQRVDMPESSGLTPAQLRCVRDVFQGASVGGNQSGTFGVRVVR